MKAEAAEVLALRALEWLVGNDELFGIFQGASGVTLDDLRRAAGDQDMLISVLDFISMDDAWVISASESLKMDPTEFVRLREALPGGGRPHWT